jgi:chaperonin GroEL (HSP60 family)
MAAALRWSARRRRSRISKIRAKVRLPASILSRSIDEPLRQIVENAREDAAVVLNTIEACKGATAQRAHERARRHAGGGYAVQIL